MCNIKSKIKKFDSFINESILYYTDDFYKLLNEIDSPIARSLTNLRNKDITPLNLNYISFTKDSDDEVQFTQNSKVKTFNKNDEVFKNGIYRVNIDSEDFSNDNYIAESEHRRYIEIFDEVKKILNVNNFDDIYFVGPFYGQVKKDFRLVSDSLKTKDDVEYVLLQLLYEHNSDEYCIIKKSLVDRIETDDIFNNKIYSLGRNKIKIGRLVRSILKDAKVSFADKDIEDFVIKWKAKINKLNNIDMFFELVSGDNIINWYDEDNYESSMGTLGSSCMRYSQCSDYFHIYTSCKNCQLLILKSEDNDTKIRGRALIWKTTTGIIFMDRVYTTDNELSQVFKEYAKKNGWSYKKVDNSNTIFNLISPNGDINDQPNIDVDVDFGLISENDRFPYVDTLKFFYYDDQFISNKQNKYKNHLVLDDTDGRIDYDDYGCDKCDGQGNNSDCSECGGSGDVPTECNNCDGTGREECYVCDGEKTLDCTSCSGVGYTENSNGDKEECESCNGAGKEECYKCDATGKMECAECGGSGEINMTCDNCDGDGKIDCDGDVHKLIKIIQSSDD